jgi:GT2 family glycosyltransferase
MNILVSVIVISYNTKELLRGCIESILETTGGLTYEIIVVDNNSDDGSAEMVLSNFRDMQLIQNKENLGFAKANNQAIAIAKGEYLLLLNSDTIVKEGMIEKLVRFMEAHPKAAAAGPKVLNYDGSLQSKGFSFPSILSAVLALLRVPKFFPEKQLFKYFPEYYWDKENVTQVDWVSGSCLLLRKEAFESIGGLSEDFFMYYEDEEWCFRAREKGDEVWYVPGAEVIHHNMASPFLDRSEAGRRSAKIFYMKTIGIFRGSVISFIFILSNLVKLIRVILKAGSKSEYGDTKERLKNEMKFLKFLIT